LDVRKTRYFGAIKNQAERKVLSKRRRRRASSGISHHASSGIQPFTVEKPSGFLWRRRKSTCNTTIGLKRWHRIESSCAKRLSRIVEGPRRFSPTAHPAIFPRSHIQSGTLMHRIRFFQQQTRGVHSLIVGEPTVHPFRADLIRRFPVFGPLTPSRRYCFPSRL
jgi:hypothetical protein